MQDSSPFRWLEERLPACQLIAVIDDATSRFYARFTEHDTTEEHSRTLGMVAALRTSFGALHRYKQHLPNVCCGAAGGTVAGRKSPFAFRTSARGVGDQMDRGAQSAGERTDRATVRNAAGPLGNCTGSRGPLYESRLTSKVRCESIEFRNGFLRPIRRQCIRDSVLGR